MDTIQVEILEYDDQSGRTRNAWEDVWPAKFVQCVSAGDVITVSKANWRVLFRQLDLAGADRSVVRYYVRRFRFLSSEEMFREMGVG